MVEFPLVKQKTLLAVDSIHLDRKQMLDVANAALTRIVFIKRKSGETYVRELDYIPEYEYLKKKNWDLSDKSILAESIDFYGKLYVKKWSGEHLSVHKLRNGKIKSSGKVNQQSPNLQNRMTCTWESVPEMVEICDMAIVNDVPVNFGNCEMVATGDYWLEVYCTDDPEDPENPEDPGCDFGDESCLCVVYGIGCEPGGGGGSNYPTFSEIIFFLDEKMDLSLDEETWLQNNAVRATEIYFYLEHNANSQKIDIVKKHLKDLIEKIDYLNFVSNYRNTFPSDFSMWWENDNWLDDPDNFNLDIDAIGNQYDKLTQAEKNLVKIYHSAAYAIKKNTPVALQEAQNRFPPGSLLNGKGDAFRHAFWMAMNERDCGKNQNLESIADKFGIAHESEVPPTLSIEKTMDLFNNNVGIILAQSYVFPIFNSNQSVANEIYQKLLNGELKYLTPLDFNISKGYDVNPHDGIQDCSTCLNGIYSNTQLKPTNQ